MSYKDSSSISNATWWVPLTYTVQEKPDFNTTQPQLWLENVLSTTVEGLPGDKSWVIFNIQETGLFLFLIYALILYEVDGSIALNGNMTVNH